MQFLALPLVRIILVVVISLRGKRYISGMRADGSPLVRHARLIRAREFISHTRIPVTRVNVLALTRRSNRTIGIIHFNGIIDATRSFETTGHRGENLFLFFYRRRVTCRITRSDKRPRLFRRDNSARTVFVVRGLSINNRRLVTNCVLIGLIK